MESYAKYFYGPGYAEQSVPLSYDRDGQTHPKEELDYSCIRDAPVVTSPLFSMFAFLEQYLTGLKIERFQLIQTEENEWQGWDHLYNRHDTGVVGWSKQ